MLPVNTQLQTLLDRCPLSEEDRHNIAVIFHALSREKQQYILDNWEAYILEMVMVRKEVDAANRVLLDEARELVDTLKDAKNARDAELLLERFRKQKHTRIELE